MIRRTTTILMLLAATACASRSASGGAARREAAAPEPADAGVVVEEPAAGGEPAGEGGEGPSSGERRLLLSLARRTIDRRLEGKDWPAVDEACVTEYLRRPLACFVTLNTANGRLRGCIGMFESDQPLYRNVMDRATAAAFSDPRFPAVRADELPGLTLEISILTPPQPLAFSSPDELLARLVPEVDGVLLHSRHGTSTYLPQVWEQLPDKVEFLGHLCEKHGAPSDCWRDPDLRVEIYHAIVFAEREQEWPESDWFAIGPDDGYRCEGE